MLKAREWMGNLNVTFLTTGKKVRLLGELCWRGKTLYNCGESRQEKNFGVMGVIPKMGGGETFTLRRGGGRILEFPLSFSAKQLPLLLSRLHFTAKK